MSRKDYKSYYVIHSKEYNYFIICLSYESILNYINDIEKEIGENKDKKTILIDQLLVTGNGRNRFLSVDICDGKIDFTSAKNVDAKQYYHQLTCSELKRNKDILKYCILTDRQVNMILEGLVI
jgi:hypothetical protein